MVVTESTEVAELAAIWWVAEAAAMADGEAMSPIVVLVSGLMVRTGLDSSILWTNSIGLMPEISR